MQKGFRNGSGLRWGGWCKVTLLAVAIALSSACDERDGDKAPVSQPASAETPAAQQNNPSAAPAATGTAQQTSYAGQPLHLLDASELQLDGASTLVLTFSIPLNPNQDFAAKVHLVDTVSGKFDGAWELAENQKELRMRHLEPKRKLMLTVDGGLQAVNGGALETAFQKEIATRDIQPSVGFASRGSLLPGKQPRGLPVMALNVDRVDVNFFRIKPSTLPSFISRWSYRSSVSSWEAGDLLKMADLVYTGRFDLNPRANTREQILLPLAGIDALQQPGVYLAVMQQAGKYAYTNAATLFTLSDIGVSLHSYHDRLDVFTQSLDNGAAQSGVDVQLLDGKGLVLASAVSDDQGHARLDKPAQAKLLLATQKGQTSLLDLKRPALDLAEFAIGGPDGFSKQLFTFGPRDLYRPGETLIVNALLRDADGRPLPPQPLKTEVVKPDGQVARSFVWQPENGLYQYQYAIPDSAPTGEWSLRIQAGDDRSRFYRFKVEDFMPERMALDIHTDDEPIAPADATQFEISGRYLYGAPAAGNRLQGQLFLREQRQLAALPGYQFGSITEENLSRNLDELDETLDSQGKRELVVASQWESIRSPARLILQASLLESGGRPITRRAEQAIWPARALPGIRPLFGEKQVYDYRSDSYKSQPMVDEGSRAAFDIIYASASGEKLAAKGLKARLIRERRDYYWQWSEDDGWAAQYDQKDLNMAEETVNLTAGGSAQVSFPVEWGAYRLEVVDPGNQLLSSVRFWAGYSWQDNSEGGGAVRPDQIRLKLDKPAYRPGERVSLTLESPAAGKGYLMVESSDGPLWWQEISVPQGGATVEVPLNKDWRRHDLYLSALVVRPGDQAKTATPKRAVGLLHLPMADEHRRLNLQLQAPERIRPGQTLTVDVKVPEMEGKTPAQVNVLLSAVDSGVLNITRFVTPDPYEAFFGRKRYGADMYDVYGQLIEGDGRQATLRFGGDGDEEDPLARGGQKPVTHVNIIARQLQPVTLNERGEGKIQLVIPDFNGELRLMAQAWTDSEFGKAERPLVVAAPLIAELATPRFLAGGDRSRLSLDLTNQSGQPQTLQISVTANGLVALDGNAERKLTLAKGERLTLPVPVQAREGFGDGEVTLEIQGLKLPDAPQTTSWKNSWKIGVRPAYPGETRQFSAVLQPGELWSLPADALSGLAPATQQGQLLLTSRPPLNLARYIRELAAYPYGCLEQTTSGLFPSLYVSQAQLTALGIKTSSDTQRRQAIDIGIERLAGMQRFNGSFGLWSKDSPEEPWLTAYVTDFLTRATAQGYSVSPSVLKGATERLQRYLQDRNQITVQYSSSPEHVRFAVQAYAGLVLARQQKAPLGALRQVYQHRGEAQSGLPLVQLGIALRLMGDMPRSKEVIAQGLRKERRDRDYWLEDYGSPLRDSALILALLNEYDILPAERDRLLLELSASADMKKYFSTQESNALYLAGRNLIGQDEAPWRVKASGVAEPLSGAKAQSTELGQAALAPGALTLENSGDSTVYPRLAVTGYPIGAPAPYSHNLHIRRHYLGLDGKQKSLDQLKSGELVLVWLDVWADDQVPDALVVDLLPAGLELENQNLGDSSASLGDSAASDVAELLTDMQQTEIKHQEYRDDRYVAAVNVDPYRHSTLLYLARAVTPGTYRVPAPQVESMYLPQWRALGETPASLTVR
ncbi:alpha-2-macroglobulin family protein [Affinibrenneria salicis]|uniref:Alpha-2-macroglobulin n=1 Tax=Affinibrenneria salicis TaxID=2590031 RepID=A0A5J5FRU0_9GAMM|nr:alpha-2-macroglobulin [Affinibrenneria salicis]KAA8995725.1 alpha-2-macroglobulin family protein [Affinibrenneria salicis]